MNLSRNGCAPSCTPGSGACYALQLRGRGVQHIHVHHGYFSSWIAMVAARLTSVPYSMTLHGSDLLLHPAYLDVKLAECKFCLTVSEFNRRHLFCGNYPEIKPGKILLRRMGTVRPAKSFRCPDQGAAILAQPCHARRGTFAPGQRPRLLHTRLPEIKRPSHSFSLLDCGRRARCAPRLSSSFATSIFGDDISLLGHLGRTQLDSFYEACDLVALTSRSEGLPLVLMEAMSHGKLVLAPWITGIPELVIHGENGFLFQPGGRR